MKRLAAVAASAAVLTAGMSFASSTAEAAGWCSSVGSAGSFCITGNGDGYNVVYSKWSGNPAYVDFNLVCGSDRYGDDGAFWISAGQSRSYYFAVGDRGRCHGQLIDRNNGGVWNTPDVG
ncbi:hypothetical protein ACFV6D_10460 [Kitasatospora sp. NPDC059812]|uniref:hypothetical protein n=1 Tax=Kitasatospora sp. NPDC059812 TaxID=3346958 RepID=UPI00365F622E